MSIESQVSLDCAGAAPPDDLVSKDGSSGVITSSQDLTTPQLPAKKQPRQWAAWTRHEEESFFSALRQVGKNFEKITSRVQSKNKDQVRHYYYRLVRRMNKLLGPELCLDAKNSKVTNAAMLRWWSLLEKYSCKASKLHLKPRRYKLFVENLENQLLRDRRKNIRKQPSQGENTSASAPNTVSNQGRTSGHDSHAVKEVPADSQKIHKIGSGKGSSVKRHTNIGINRGNCKAEPSAVKAARHRKKKGSPSTAAYRKWEKAAIAGVSLVADAAEHLERTAPCKEVEHVQDRHFQSGMEQAREDVHPLATLSQNLFSDDNVQGSAKLKLQLFPIDEGTRRALEMDNHNPYLELTLSTRKKISSVLEHLKRKWGNSSIACGELMLFPYSVQKENLVGYQKWTKECNLNAADVYALVGSPPVFRLRYGWFSNAELGSAMIQLPLSSTSAAVSGHNAMKEQNVDLISTSNQPSFDGSAKLSESIKDQLLPATEITTATPSLIDSQTEMHGPLTTMGSNVNILRYSENVSSLALPRGDSGIDTLMRQVDSLDDLRTHKGTASSAGEWADSLTNISVGDLLSEASHNVDANCINSPAPCSSSHSLQQIPFSCDSFDAAIAAHIYKHQNKAVFQPAVACHGSSIWDAEETCDGFSFQKNGLLLENIQGVPSYTSGETHKQIARSSSAATDATVQELDGAEEPLDDHPVRENLVDECLSDSSGKDLNGLTDIYWPDSLGPLDMDIPSCRYRSEDLILSDSLGGLNRLIASSLDAFQNCSFFGLDKKEPASTVEARETASFADYEIGTEV